MPQLWRARLTNIEYDAGKKIYADELFRFNGQNTLINLANGGGKTLLIQLLLQTVLPNEPLNKRPLSDLLSGKKYTGHILVEWKLDNPEPTFLTAGFCFTRGNDEDERLKYFLYTIHYREANDFDIKNIPLVDDKTPLSYPELLALLRAAPKQETKIDIFERDDKRRAYLNHLASYNIYEKEWRNIKTTNSVEGGVGEFFASAKTSKQLLENILIPAVEETVFTGEEEAQRLAAAFQQVYRDLIRLPELQKNLHDFQVLRSEGEHVLQRVREFAGTQGKLVTEKVKLRSMGNRVDEELSQVRLDLAKIEEELAASKNRRHELNYLKESIPYAYLLGQKVAAENAHHDAASQLAQASLRHADAQLAWRLSKGRNIYLERAELLAANKALEKRRELASLGQEDQLAELDVARATFRAVLEDLYAEAEKEHDDCRQANLDLAEHLEEQKQRLDGLRITDKDLAKSLAEVETILKGYQETWDILARDYQNMAWIEDPGSALRELGLVLQRLATNLTALGDKRQALIKELKERGQQIRELAVKISETQNSINILAKDQEAAEKSSRELQEALGRYSIRCVNPHAERSRIEAELTARKIDLRDKLRLSGFKIEQLKDQLALIRENEAYVPNREILKVQKLLQEMQIPTQLGSKWLVEQGVDEKQRANYLRHNPLLPYALVLAEEDFRRLQGSKSLTTELLSSPVPLLVRRPELVPPGEIKAEKILSVAGSAYLLWHQGYSYALSAESLGEVATELENALERETRHLQNLQASEEQIVKLDELQTNYYRLFPAEYLPNLVENLRRARLQLANLTGEQEDVAKAETKAEADLATIERKQSEGQEEERQRQRDWDRFAEWQRQAADRTKRLEERKALQSEQSRVAAEITGAKDQEEVLREETLRGELRLKDLGSLKQAHAAELQQVLPPGRPGVIPREEGYQEAKASWQASEIVLDRANAELKSFDETIKRNLGDIAKAEKALTKDLRLALSDVEEARNKIAEEEIDRLEAETNRLSQEIESAQAAVNKQSGIIDRLDGQLEEKANNIEKVYHLAPATDFADLESARAKISRELEALRQQDDEWKQILIDTKNTEKTLSDAWHSLSTSIRNFDVPTGEEALTLEEWAKVKGKLAQAIESLTKELRGLQESMQKQRGAVEKSFRDYGDILRAQGNSTLDRFVSHLLADEERRFQVDVVEQSFAKSFELIANYEEKTVFELEEKERNKQELVGRSINQAQRIAQEMQMIDRYVKVDYAGKRVNAVQVKLKEWEKDKSQALMEAYINDLIKELKRQAEAGEPEEKQEKFIERKMSSRQLLNTLSSLDQANVRVLKPEQHPTAPYFDRWDDVQKWSGGERFAGYMAMFMAILSYTRSRVCSLHNPYKVMLADNPFGVASSPHVLNLIFQLAESNNVQMICLSALTEDSIYPYFPSVYSLRLQPFAGKDFMTSKVERGSYHIDPLEEELKKKRQIEFAWGE